MKPLNLLFAALLIIIGMVFVSIKLIPDNVNEELIPVTLRMSWTPSVRFAPFLLAQEKGFYAEEGLKLEMFSSKGSTLAVKVLASGTNDFGFIAGDTVLTGRIKGMPLKVIAALYQKSPVGIMSFKDAGIKSPKDLEGKKLSSDPQSTMQQEFFAFAKKTDIDLEKIKLVPVSGTSQAMQLLMNGDVDASLVFYYTSETILENEGFTDIETILFDDYGIHIYSKSLVTREDMIENHPDIVRKFVKATIRGWEYAINHPEEAIDILIKHYPEMDKVNELTTFKKSLPLLESEVTQKYGLGYQIEEQWEGMQDILYDFEIIDKKIDVAPMYTNEFLG